MTLVLLILLCAAAVLGWHMGFIQQVVSLLGFVLAVVVAWGLADSFAGPVVAVLGTSAFVSKAIAFVLTTLVGTILLSWVAALLTHIVDFLPLGFVNRGLGVVVSVAKYGIILGFILKMLLFVGTLSTERIQQSWVAQPLTEAADAVLRLAGFN